MQKASLSDTTSDAGAFHAFKKDVNFGNGNVIEQRFFHWTWPLDVDSRFFQGAWSWRIGNRFFDNPGWRFRCRVDKLGRPISVLYQFF